MPRKHASSDADDVDPGEYDNRRPEDAESLQGSLEDGDDEREGSSGATPSDEWEEMLEDADIGEWEERFDHLRQYKEGDEVFVGHPNGAEGVVRAEIVYIDNLESPTARAVTENGKEIELNNMDIFTMKMNSPAETGSIGTELWGDKVVLGRVPADVDLDLPPVPDSVELGPATREAVEREFGIDLSDTRTLTPDDLDAGSNEEFEALNLNRDELVDALVEGGHDREDARTVVELGEEWKRNSGLLGEEAGETLEAIAQRALAVDDAEVRQIRHVPEIDDGKVTEGTVEVYRDLTRITRAHVRETMADENDRVELNRGLAHAPRNMDVLESYVEKSVKTGGEPETVSTEFSVLSNTTSAENGGRTFAKVFEVDEQVGVDEIGYSSEFVTGRDGITSEAEVSIVGGERSFNVEDVRIPGGFAPSYISDNDGEDMSLSEGFAAVVSPETAEKEDFDRVKDFTEEWRNQYTRPADPLGEPAHDRGLESDVVADRFEEVADASEEHGYWSEDEADEFRGYVDVLRS